MGEIAQKNIPASIKLKNVIFLKKIISDQMQTSIPMNQYITRYATFANPKYFANSSINSFYKQIVVEDLNLPSTTILSQPIFLVNLIMLDSIRF